jgi:hypothetical protein
LRSSPLADKARPTPFQESPMAPVYAFLVVFVVISALNWYEFGRVD